MTEEIKKEKDPKYTHSQACVILKLGHYDRKVVEKKYKGRTLTLQTWKNYFKKDNLKF